MALKSTSLHGWHCPFPNHWRLNSRTSREKKATICPHFLSTCDCFPVCCVCKYRVHKRISSHLLFQCPSAKLLPESTVQVSCKGFPFPRFLPPVVRVAFAIPTARGSTHPPEAPGAAPAAASHLQLVELMPWPKDRHSAPRSTRRNTQPEPQPHFKTLSRRQCRPKLFPQTLISTVAPTKPSPEKG